MKKIGIGVALALLFAIWGTMAVVEAQSPPTIQITKPIDRHNVEIGTITVTVQINGASVNDGYAWQLLIDQVPEKVVQGTTTTQVIMPDPSGPHRIQAVLLDPKGAAVANNEVLVMAAPIEEIDQPFNQSWFAPVMGVFTIAIIGIIILGLRLHPRVTEQDFAHCMRKLVALVAMLIALFAVPLTASAHAVVVACFPRIGSNALQPPNQLVCQFNEPLVPTEVSLVVTNAQGQRVDKNDSQLWQGDNESVVVSLDTSKMAPGIYTTQWMVNNTLDHVATNGSFQFGVNKVVPPTATPELPGFVITPTPVQTDSSGANGLIPRFLIGVGVVLLLAMGFVFWRMRSSATAKQE